MKKIIKESETTGLDLDRVSTCTQMETNMLGIGLKIKGTDTEDTFMQTETYTKANEAKVKKMAKGPYTV